MAGIHLLLGSIVFRVTFALGNSNNYFIVPPAAGSAESYGSDLVLAVGSTQVLQWQTDLTSYYVALFQQVETSGGVQHNQIYTAEGTQSTGTVSFAWEVQLYDTQLSLSQVYFFWVNPGPSGFTSHYFNISDSGAGATLGVSALGAPQSTTSTMSISSTSIATSTSTSTLSSSSSTSTSTGTSSSLSTATSRATSMSLTSSSSSSSSASLSALTTANLPSTATSSIAPAATLAGNNADASAQSSKSSISDTATMNLALGLGVGLGVPLILLGALGLFLYHRKQKAIAIAPESYQSEKSSDFYGDTGAINKWMHHGEELPCQPPPVHELAPGHYRQTKRFEVSAGHLTPAELSSEFARR